MAVGPDYNVRPYAQNMSNDSSPVSAADLKDVKKMADNVERKMWGIDIRYSISESMRLLDDIVAGNKQRQDHVEDQFQDVIENTTGKDVISAPEIIAARNGKPNLKRRIDDLEGETTAQLAQIANGVSVNALTPPPPFQAIVPDANYYNSNTQKYYSNSDMSVPATDNHGRLTGLVNYLEARGGGTILLPHGNIKVVGGVKWKSKVSLVGAGATNTMLLGESSTNIFSLIHNLDGGGLGTGYDNPDNWLEDCRFEHFGIDMKGLTHTGASVDGKALFILYMKRARFSNLVLKNTIGTALGCDFLVDTVIDKVFVDNAGRNWGNANPQTGNISAIGQSGIGVGTGAYDEETLVISNCVTTNCGNYGIFVEAQSDGSQGVHNSGRTKGVKIANCFSFNNRIGYGNKGSGATIYDNVFAFRNRESGLLLKQRANGDQIVNSQIAYNGRHGIHFDRNYGGNATVSNNHIFGNYHYGVAVSADVSFNYDYEQMNFSNNTIYDNGGDGLFVELGDPSMNRRFDVVGNTFFNNGQRIEASVGLRIVGVENTNILNNIFYDNQVERTQVHPMLVGTNTTNYFINGNDFSDYKNVEGIWVHSIDGKIGVNHGFNNSVSGRETIPVGTKAIYVTDYINKRMGKSKEKFVSITPLTTGSSVEVWVQPNIEGNRFRVERENVDSAVEFLWEVKI